MTLGWQADELATATGAINGMAKSVSTKMYLADVVKYAHTRMSERFDDFVDMAYLNSHSTLHHVYEWRLNPKDPQAKLWKHVLVGHGANRHATWDWRASKMPILTPEERASDENDPMSTLSAEDVDSFSDRKYIFYWKAPVMEGSFPVTIRPVNVKRLMFPNTDGSGELAWATSVRVENPGGRQTTGAFTTLWTTWWNTEAPRVFEETLAPEFERDAAESTRLQSRKRRGTVGITTVADYQRLMEMAEDWAEVNIDKYRRKYRTKK